MITADLFPATGANGADEPLGEGAVVLRGFARADEAALLRAVERTAAPAPCGSRNHGVRRHAVFRIEPVESVGADLSNHGFAVRHDVPYRPGISLPFRFHLINFFRIPVGEIDFFLDVFVEIVETP